MTTERPKPSEPSGALAWDNVISVKDLAVHFPIGGGLLTPKIFVHAVEGVSLDIPRGSFFGLVGESGSGKTTLGLALLRDVSSSWYSEAKQNGHFRLQTLVMTKFGMASVDGPRIAPE